MQKKTTKAERNADRLQNAAFKLQDAYHLAGAIVGAPQAMASIHETLLGRLDAYSRALDCYFEAHEMLQPTTAYAELTGSGCLVDELELNREAMRIFDATCKLATAYGIDAYEGTVQS